MQFEADEVAMSNPAPKAEEDPGHWSDPDAYRAEFQRRLAENGIRVNFQRKAGPWRPPVTLPVSADEASAVVIRMRRGED